LKEINTDLLAKTSTTSTITARQFIDKLTASATGAEQEKNQRYFKEKVSGNKILGVRFAIIFALAKEFMDMDIVEVEKLLGNPYYELRMGAVSIMDFQARSKKADALQKKKLFDLYIQQHDRINNWDLVDRAAPYVVGGYLADKPRKVLYDLARSKNVWERRTAIVSTYYFILQDDLSDTFKIAGLLVNDPHEMIQMAVGSWIREAGKRNEKMLVDFLDRYAAKMPAIMLRYAMEKLEKKAKDHYLQQRTKRDKTEQGDSKS
jgi:3-methyladenine DNA glycosylase AlkD